MPVVVSDTSPIRALGHLGLVHLLGDLYLESRVPPAVEFELANPPPGMVAVDVRDYPFIQVQAPAALEQVRRFSDDLDRGEAEALALALEVQADLVLMDEAAGRAAVKRLGLSPVGVLGTLVRGKQRGHVSAIAPLIDRLQNELRFFISARLRSDVLRSAGESP